MIMHWPQITFIILAGASLGIHIALNGEYRKYHAGKMLLATVIELWLLYCGGFFG